MPSRTSKKSTAASTEATTASLAGELTATIDEMAGKQVAGLDTLRAAAAKKADGYTVSRRGEQFVIIDANGATIEAHGTRAKADRRAAELWEASAHAPRAGEQEGPSSADVKEAAAALKVEMEGQWRATDYEVGQQVEFAANRVWYPGTVTKATKTTVTVTYVKGSGQSYTATVNPDHAFNAGGALGKLSSRIRPLSSAVKPSAEQAAVDSEHIAARYPTAAEMPDTPTLEWGTAKTHGLKAGDEIWYGGRIAPDKPWPQPERATVVKTAPSLLIHAAADGKVLNSGGVASRFHAAKIDSDGAAELGEAIQARMEKASAAKAPAAKATPAKAAAPAKKVVARTDPANVTATNVAGFPIGPAEPNQERIGLPVPGHAGYFVRYARGAYDLAARIGTEDGPAWLALCRHAAFQGSDQLMGPDTSAEKLAARRKEWCPDCAAGNPATDYTAGQESQTAKATPAKKATTAKKASPAKASGPVFNIRAFNDLTDAQKVVYQEAKAAGAAAADALATAQAAEPTPAKKASRSRRATK